MPFAIDEELKLLPDKPGVYLMKNAIGQVIYIGKAVNLRSRVRSYFQSRHLDTKTVLLVQNIASFETIVVASELEALILESNMIKQHQPHYNILLRDDHHYPFLRLSIQDPFPRLTVVHRMDKDGARYFGPFPGRTVYPTLEALKKVFPLRTCNRSLPAQTPQRACLDHHIKRCSGPCIGAISEADYRLMLKPLTLFLEGKRDELSSLLQEDMETAASDMNFERAATIRDQLRAIQRLQETQRVEGNLEEDMDIIAMARKDNEAQVVVVFHREGKVIGRSNFAMTGIVDQDRSDILTSFVKQYYLGAESIPPQIILQDELLSDEHEVIRRWIAEKRGGKVTIRVPQRGERVELVELAAKNALQVLSRDQIRRNNDRQEAAQALEELAEHLKLPQAPWRIEAYDISNTQGNYSVASMVVFEQGIPARKEYRRFRIKLVEGPNDYASMQEVLSRRFRRATDEKVALSEGRLLQSQIKFANLPDLVLIDGGKGQLQAARESMKETGYLEITTIGLAKQHELIYLEGHRMPLNLSHRSKALHLLQRIRDEAHRYAVSYHRDLRDDSALNSALEQIPGIGKTRVRLLLKTYGGLDKLALASVEELSDLKGMSVKSAEAVHAFLRLKYGEGVGERYREHAKEDLLIADKEKLPSSP
ncbi:MAG: excinuclease ABC subunit UvrC [Symbiobacteriaceae bacterium]|nr:excinuclease ABC subunit UvrC [Symbiobacteriaceae bacterium]